MVHSARHGDNVNLPAHRAGYSRLITVIAQPSTSREEAITLTSSAERIPPVSLTPTLSAIGDLARRQGVLPIVSAEDLAMPGAFEHDADYDAFIADLYASRQASIG